MQVSLPTPARHFTQFISAFAVLHVSTDGWVCSSNLGRIVALLMIASATCQAVSFTSNTDIVIVIEGEAPIDIR